MFWTRTCWNSFLYNGSRRLLRLARASRRRRRVATTILVTSGGVVVATTAATANQPKPNKNDLVAMSGASLRFLRSVAIASTISVDYFVSKLLIDEDDVELMSAVHTRNAERVLKGCLINGGTYIKVGQGLVSLSHLLPKEYVTTLTKLQDKCLTQNIDEVRQLFAEEFGKSPDELYGRFEEEPVAAASLAQVFVATTKDDRKVAVKVQYNDLQKRFASDISTIHFLLRLGGLIHSTFDFAWILEDLTHSLREELDFYNEAKNAERCARDLKHLHFVHVPKVHWDLCSNRILVTEWVDGIKINATEKLLEAGHKISEIDYKMFRVFGEQIFQTGFVHADPHPGNILVRKHHNESQLVLLDHGLYQNVTTKERVALSEFWKALVLQNHKAMQKYSLELGVEDYKKLAEILTQRPLTKDFKLVTKLTPEDLKYFQEVAAQKLDMITKTLKDMPRSLLFVVRNLNTLRAISHDHGDLVDRYTILARAATKNAFKSHDYLVKKIFFVPTLLNFEYQLLKNRLWFWFVTMYFNVLRRLGRSPDASGVISQMN